MKKLFDTKEEMEQFVKTHPVPDNIKNNISPLEVSNVYKQLATLGVNTKTLEEDGEMQLLLTGNKTSKLIPLNFKLADVPVQFNARLSMNEQSNEQRSLCLHPVKSSIQDELNKPFYGHKFTEEEKGFLLATGNAGKPIQIVKEDGTPQLVLVSIDKLTNEPVAVPKEKVLFSNQFNNVDIPPEKIVRLKEGECVLHDNMKSQDGNIFSGMIQYNADKQKLELLPIGLNVTKVQGIKLSEIEQQSLHEGKTILIPELIDEKGEKYSAWVRLDKKEHKIDMSKDYSSQDQKENTRNYITPANANKTQVAQNSQGFKTEENKFNKQPLKSGKTKTI